jgi:hypothetical protein
MTIQDLWEWIADPVLHNLVLNRTEVAMLLRDIERAIEEKEAMSTRPTRKRGNGA